MGFLNSFLPAIIPWIPTIIFVMAVLLSFIRGILRGFRKSLIFFIHWIIAFGGGLVVFIIMKNNLYTMNYNFAFKFIPEFNGINLHDATTVESAVEIAAKSLANQYAGLATVEEIRQAALAFVGLALSIALAVIFLVVLPIIIRLLLWILYLLFYREGKVKRRKLDEGEEYSKHRFGGMIIGIVRGVLTGVLLVSSISSLYFIIAGGDFENADRSLNINNYVKIDLNVDDMYKAVLKSRKTGIGLLLDKIAFDYDKDGEKESIDYLMFDLVMSSPKFENLKGEKKNVYLREELGFIVQLAGELSDKGILTIQDGKPKVDVDKLRDSQDVLDHYIDQSVLLGDVVPLVLVGAVRAIQEDKIPNIPANIKTYFEDETLIEKLKSDVDYRHDLKQILSVAINAIELVPATDGKLDFSALSDMKTIMSLNPEKVKKIFNDLADVSLITKIVAPVGAAFGLERIKTTLQEKGKDVDVSSIDLAKVDWKAEFENLGNVYEQIFELELDFDELKGKDANGILDYVQELAKNDEKKAKIDALIDLLIAPEAAEGEEQKGSYLVSNFALVGTKYIIKTTDLSESLGQSWAKVQANVDKYTTTSLNKDLHTIIDSVSDVIPIYKQLSSSDTSDPFKMINEIDADKLKKGIIGTFDSETGKYSGGIYDLELLSYVDDEGHKLSLFDDIIEELLLKTAGSTLGEERIKSVSDWKEEIIALGDSISTIKDIDGIADIDMNNFMGTMPTLTEENVDKLTRAASTSIILSGILNDKIIEYLDKTEQLQYRDELNNVISWKDSGITWNEEFVKNGEDEYVLDSEGKRIVAKHGEINRMLKAVCVFTKKDDEGKSRFVDEEGNLKADLSSLSKLTREETDSLTNSKVIDYALDKIVGDEIDKMDDMSMPKDLSWANQYSEDGTTLVKKGELYALTQILGINAIKDDEGNPDFNKLSNLNTLKLLDVKDSTETRDDDIDILLDSQIVAHNLPKIMDDKVGSALGDEHISNVVSDWKIEMRSIVSVVRIDGIITTGPDGTSSFDVSLDTFANLIKDNGNDYTDVYCFAKSRMIMKGLSSKVESLNTEGSTTIIIPNMLKDTSSETNNWLRWSYEGDTEPTTDAGYKTGEFAKLITVLYNAKKAVQVPGETVELTINNLGSGIISMDDHSVVSDSAVLFATMSNVVVDNVRDNVVKARNIAYKENVPGYNPSEDLLSDVVIVRNEIAALLDAIHALGITSTDNINVSAKTVLTLIGDEHVRELINASNIMNITVADKISNSGDAINVPLAYQDINQEKWYSESGDWRNGELNKLLLAINSLGITTDPANDNVVEFNADNIIDNLTDARIDDVYASYVISLTISKRIFDSGLTVKDDYLKNSAASRTEVTANLTGDTDKFIAKVEFKNLVHAIQTLGVRLNTAQNITIATVTAKTEEQLATISASAIIATKVSDIIHGISDIETPTNVLFDTQYIYNDEVLHLLVATKKSGLDMDNAGSIDLAKITAKGSTNITNAVDESDIFRATISKKITVNGGITIPSSYDYTYSYDEAHKESLLDSENYLIAKELNALIRSFVDVLSLNDFATITNNLISSITPATLADDDNWDILKSSGTLQYMFSVNVINQGVVTYDYPTTQTGNVDHVAVVFDGVTYVLESQIHRAIQAVDALEIDLNNISSINLSKIYELTAEQRTAVGNSAILCTKFSQLINDTMINSYNTMLKDPSDPVVVKQSAIYVNDLDPTVKFIACDVIVKLLEKFHA